MLRRRHREASAVGSPRRRPRDRPDYFLGALIYAIAVLGNAMATDLGISRTLVFAAFSGSLVVSGLVGPRVGALIDRRGGRRVLAWGAAGAAVSLGAVAIAPSALMFVLAWGLVGVARAMTLYEAAFATLSQHRGRPFAGPDRGHAVRRVCRNLRLSALPGRSGDGRVAGHDRRLRGSLELFICLPLHLWCIPARARCARSR